MLLQKICVGGNKKYSSSQIVSSMQSRHFVKSFGVKVTDDYTSHSTYRIIKAENLSHPPKEKDEVPKIHRNPSNIQMISTQLFQQVFRNATRRKIYPKPLIEKVKEHLSSHSLWNQEVAPVSSVEFQIPLLEGNSIDEHFRNIALQQTHPYRELIKEIVESQIPEAPLEWVLEEGWIKYTSDGPIRVPYPEEDVYVFDVEVSVTNGHVPTLATAVSNKAWYSWCSPTLVGGIDRDKNQQIVLDDLIPFETESGNVTGSWKEKLIIGHNVSYDRARIREQYFLEPTKLRFMDTMSLHIAVSGITSYQRALKMSMKSGLQTVAPKTREDLMIAGSLEWNDISSLNNLRDVYKLYCNGKELDKEKRNIFVTGTIPEIRDSFQELMSYCARDVKATHEVFVNLMPSYYERFPHPVSLSGILEMGMAYLPINSNWSKYINHCEEAYENLQNEIKLVLVEKAKEALKLLKDEKYKRDPWLWDLDWKVTKPLKRKVKSDIETSGKSKQASELGMPAWYKKLLYKEDEENYSPGPSNISTSMRIVPKLLRLCWYGFPLHYSKKGGWGYLIKRSDSDRLASNDKGRSYYPSVDEATPSEESEISGGDEEPCGTSTFPYDDWLTVWEKSRDRLMKQVEDSKAASFTQQMESHMRSNSEEVAQELKDFVKGLKAVASIGLRKNKRGNGSFPKSLEGASPHPKCDFVPLPHKDGDNFRVGNPLAKDFLTKIEEGTLSCATGEDIANRVVCLSKMVSYWRNTRDRIMGQMTVWFKDRDVAFPREGEAQYGAILPQVAVAGTLTRRAVERTWMTASNAYLDRVGSELKGIIQAPPGYHFVGADVDSQELWIASVIGDADFGGFHGSTALGWMVLQGTKSAGTDMHSKTASLIGIPRDKAKILNYGRIYGAGVTYAERLLKQFNPELSKAEARHKATTMYKSTKGQKKYILNDEGLRLINPEGTPQFQNVILSRDELFSLLNSLNHPPADYMDLVKRVIWDDGTESPMFNRLEEIAQMECPVTPILGCCISRSLVPSVVHEDFMTSRVNWVVQSSAVDFLHLMLTSMRWLMEKYKINGRFSLSVHDEVRYLIKTEDRYKAALALQITNLLTRSLCSHSVGIDDLPESVAFFSSVDIDKVLRKEVTDDCVTPSNPTGLKNNYQIPQGEALSMTDLMNVLNKKESS